jgi:Monoamine oxidase
MAPAGFKLTILASEQPQTHALDCMATGVSYTKSYCFNFSERIHLKKPVVQIRYMDGGVMVKALDGTVFNGLYVILAIPPPANVSSDIRFTEPRVLGAY